MTRGVPAPDWPRCGIPTQHGQPCQRPRAVDGGRCSLHRSGRICPRRRPDRRPRINQRGEVLCHNCDRYLPADHFRWMDCPSIAKPRFWSYCYDCTRQLDRLRWRGERRERNNQTRIIRRRRQQAAERTERQHFVTTSIDLLRRRGFTKAEIAKLCGVSWTTLLSWERGERRVTMNGSRRIGIVVWETRYLKAGPEPCYRRRLPHPDLAMLLARIEPQLAPYPLRSRWRDHEEQAA